MVSPVSTGKRRVTSPKLRRTRHFKNMTEELAL